MGSEHPKELKRPQKESERLRRAVSDLTLEQLILSEAARETCEPVALPDLHRPDP